MIDKNILYRFFDGSATDHEVGQVRAWVDASPENRCELLRERKIFDATLLLADRDASHAGIRPVHRPAQKRIIRLRIPQMAAMLTVVFALGMLVRRQAGSDEKPAVVALYEVMAPLGAKSQVTLSDGTKVWLNAGSRLVYASTFGQQNREVQLEGEAYFEVAKNRALPFDVKTSKLNIRAVGTAFNVKAYPGEATIETILVEGEVEVSRTGKTGSDGIISLQPRQRLTLNKSNGEMVCETTRRQERTSSQPLPETLPVASIAVKKVEAATDFMIQTSWKDRFWRIESEELGSFATKLERRYNVTIVFRDRDLAKYRFNGTFDDEPIEELLRALALAAPVKFSLEGHQVTLSRNNRFQEAHQTLYGQPQ